MSTSVFIYVYLCLDLFHLSIISWLRDDCGPQIWSIMESLYQLGEAKLCYGNKTTLRSKWFKTVILFLNNDTSSSWAVKGLVI
jgi:hypothetical protein